MPILEKAGFEWVEKRHDGSNAQTNSISFEREKVEGQIDFVVIIFDKHRRAAFQVALGSKAKTHPHEWVRGGSIVWSKSGLDRHNWWGAKWWHINKHRSFRSAVKRVAKALPQADDFLTNGRVGHLIWKS